MKRPLFIVVALALAALVSTASAERQQEPEIWYRITANLAGSGPDLSGLGFWKRIHGETETRRLLEESTDALLWDLYESNPALFGQLLDEYGLRFRQPIPTE